MSHLIWILLSLKTFSLPTHVDSVMIMPEGAVVTRIGKVDVQSGDWEFLIPNLPNDLDNSTVTAQASRGIKITDVFVTREKSEVALKRVRELKAKLDSVANELKKLNDELSIIDVQESLLIINVDVSRFASLSELLKARLDTTAWSASLKFVGGRLQSLKARARQINRRIDRLEALKDSLSNRLNELISNIGESKTVHIVAHTTGTGRLKVTYRLSSPSWKPEYEFRAASGGDSLTVIYYASVNQQTGEDWKDIKLVISTAVQPHYVVLPQFVPQYLSSYYSRPKGSRMLLAAAPIGAKKSMPTEGAAPTVSHTQLFSLIALPSRVTVPSGDWHKLRIDRIELPATFDYVAYPYTTSDVFLVAHSLNRSDYPILGGTASLFLDDNFLRKIRIPEIPIGDTIKLSYGVDPRMKAVRKLVKKMRSKTWDNKVRIEYQYEIEVKNLHSSPVSVKVVDRYPISQDKRIKVKLLKIDPQPVEIDESTGKIVWRVEPEAGRSVRIHFGYIIEHPQDMMVQGVE